MLRWQPLLESHRAIPMIGLLPNFAAEFRRTRLFPRLKRGNFINRLRLEEKNAWQP